MHSTLQMNECSSQSTGNNTCDGPYLFLFFVCLFDCLFLRDFELIPALTSDGKHPAKFHELSNPENAN